jgi:GT2 family glycosyltransferase
MPLAGDPEAALHAVAALRSLATRPADELILVDNSGTVGDADGVVVVAATGERSPAHARNAGAARANGSWILFIDADAIPRPNLLDAYFEQPIDDRIGALAGEVRPAGGADSLAARYGAERNFLGQRAHLDHPFRARAAAANLLVRRAAFEQVGGFYEGVRAGEDTDFTWRLQQAGWRLELRPKAWVEHRYRATVSELRRQWRGYAAGRAWLARRYEGFRPEPGVVRAARRVTAQLRHRPAAPQPHAARSTAPELSAPKTQPASALERAGYLALDALLSLDELAGLALSNRPATSARDQRPASVVAIADRFPTRGDPLVELAASLESVRVEAVARPETLDPSPARSIRIDYLEDDGLASRVFAAAALIVRHPLRVARGAAPQTDPPLTLLAVAPAVRRLAHDPDARIVALGDRSQPLARRLARLAGRPAGELSRP